MVSQPNWTILTIQTEEQFNNIWSENKPDIIISDLVMATDQSGMEILKKAKEKDPLVMVILITAYEKKLNRYKAFDLGAFDCVQKNTPGVIAAEEILVKTKAALRFRELALEQIENQRRISFLRRYFDPRVFKTIENNPNLLNIHNKTLTICFWDIRGFSLLCEVLKAHPTLISGFLREYSSKAAEVIFGYDGVLDKVVGDGIVGLFGALSNQQGEGKKDCENALNAAIDFKRHFDEILARWLKQWILYTPQNIDIGIACGVNTGEVLVGNVGTEIRDQYTALGSHVNFASRLCSVANKGQILVSQATEARVSGHFILEEVNTLDDVKNIPGKFRIFSVKIPNSSK